MRTRNRWIAVVSVAAVVLALIWLVAAGGDDDDGSETIATTTTSTTTTSTTTTSTTTTAPTTTAPTTTETTSTPAVPGPGPVIALDALAGAGSGEIELAWGTVPGATGYRVLRADTVDGPFTTAAEIDVTTGAATGAEGVTNVWSNQHRYLPPGEPFTAPDTSAQIRYVEASFAPQRCFRVVALGPAGPGPESAVVCGSPP